MVLYIAFNEVSIDCRTEHICVFGNQDVLKLTAMCTDIGSKSFVIKLSYDVRYMYLIRPANTTLLQLNHCLKYLLESWYFISRVHGHHTMRAYGEVIIHLYFISKTKNCKSGPY